MDRVSLQTEGFQADLDYCFDVVEKELPAKRQIATAATELAGQCITQVAVPGMAFVLSDGIDDLIVTSMEQIMEDGLIFELAISDDGTHAVRIRALYDDEKDELGMVANMIRVTSKGVLQMYIDGAWRTHFCVMEDELEARYCEACEHRDICDVYKSYFRRDMAAVFREKNRMGSLEDDDDFPWAEDEDHSEDQKE